MNPANRRDVARFWAFLLSAAALAAPLVPGARGGEDKVGPPPAETAPAPAGFSLPSEFDLSQSYVGSGDVLRNGRENSLDEYNSEARLVLTPRIPLGYLRLGAEWTRYSFGYSRGGGLLPNTLQSVSLVVGLDTKFSDSVLVRIEAQPGLYGTFFNHIDSGQFNVPFLVGGTYIYSPDLQFIGGVSVDLNRKYPVIPAAGLRWKFAPKWVLDGVLPTPRFEYELNHATTLFAGVEFKEDTFRLGPRDGASRLDRRLNRALVTFSELRAGAGLEQKISPSLTLTAECGCQPYREFDFYRADARFRSDGIAPYGQIMLHGAF